MFARLASRCTSIRVLVELWRRKARLRWLARWTQTSDECRCGIGIVWAWNCHCCRDRWWLLLRAEILQHFIFKKLIDRERINFLAELSHWNHIDDRVEEISDHRISSPRWWPGCVVRRSMRYFISHDKLLQQILVNERFQHWIKHLRWLRDLEILHESECVAFDVHKVLRLIEIAFEQAKNLLLFHGKDGRAICDGFRYASRWLTAFSLLRLSDDTNWWRLLCYRFGGHHRWLWCESLNISTHFSGDLLLLRWRWSIAHNVWRLHRWSALACCDFRSRSKHHLSWLWSLLALLLRCWWRWNGLKLVENLWDSRCPTIRSVDNLVALRADIDESSFQLAILFLQFCNDVIAWIGCGDWWWQLRRSCCCCRRLICCWCCTQSHQIAAVRDQLTKSRCRLFDERRWELTIASCWDCCVAETLHYNFVVERDVVVWTWSWHLTTGMYRVTTLRETLSSYFF